MTTTKNNTPAAEPGPVPATPAALAAVAEIKALRNLVVQMAQVAEAQIMERLWRVRSEFDDERNYCRFVEFHLSIPQKQALAYVAAWEGARQNRRLRELAQSEPSQAMEFVQRLTDHGLDDVTEKDSEVARLLSLPPRKQIKVLRELLDAKEHANDGRLPDDVRRIDELETQLAVSGLPSTQDAPAARARALTDHLVEMHRELVARDGDIAVLSRGSQTTRDLAVMVADNLIGLLEQISAAALRMDDDGQ